MQYNEIVSTTFHFPSHKGAIHRLTAACVNHFSLWTVIVLKQVTAILLNFILQYRHLLQCKINPFLRWLQTTMLLLFRVFSCKFNYTNSTIQIQNFTWEVAQGNVSRCFKVKFCHCGCVENVQKSARQKGIHSADLKKRMPKAYFILRMTYHYYAFY